MQSAMQQRGGVAQFNSRNNKIRISAHGKVRRGHHPLACHAGCGDGQKREKNKFPKHNFWVLRRLNAKPGGGISRHGVVAAASPRVATQDAAQGQPRATERPVLDDGLPGILRTRRCEAATWRRKGRDAALVEHDGEAKELPHEPGQQP